MSRVSGLFPNISGDLVVVTPEGEQFIVMSEDTVNDIVFGVPLMSLTALPLEGLEIVGGASA